MKFQFINIIYTFIFLIVLNTIVLSDNKIINIKLQNPSEVSWIDEFIQLKLSDIHKEYKDFSEDSFSIFIDNFPITFQIESNHNNEKLISFVVDFEPNEKEPGGIRNEKEFIDYLNQTIEKMNNPIIIAK